MPINNNKKKAKKKPGKKKLGYFTGLVSCSTLLITVLKAK